MEVIIINQNIVILLNKAQASVSMEKISTKASALYGDVNPQIISFPEVKTLLVPEKQIQIVFEGKRGTIIKEEVLTAPTPDPKYIQLAAFIPEVVEAKVTDFGFNLIGEIHGSELENTIKKLNTNTINNELGSKLPTGVKFDHAFPNIVTEVGEARLDTRFSLNLDSESNPDKIAVTQNVHFHQVEYFDYEKLLNEYKKFQKLFFDLIDKLIS